jgi:diguanylate cyclase (GGDEF)-like protein
VTLAKKISLLIVDDDDVDREKIRRILNASRHDSVVEEASSVKDSVAFLNDNKYDCIVIDYRLGHEDGLDLLKIIKNNSEHHSAVIMVTGLGDEEVAAEAMRLGASDYLIKSQIEPSRLIKAVNDAIKKTDIEKSMRDLAHYDSLTGLVSRHLLLDRVQQTINSISRTKKIAAIVFIDLDDFKPINDSYGHQAGDSVLVEVACRLKNALRETDTVSRLGGDEFVLLLTDIESASLCEDLLKRILLILSVPITLESGRSVRISSSVGISIIDEFSSLDAHACLKKADQAMYQAKNNGRNKIRFYDPLEDQRQKERRALLQNVESGLINNNLFLVFQPQLNLISNELIGFEALIRWQNNDEVLMPKYFMEALRNSTLGVSIGEWVLRESFASRSKMRARGIKDSCKLSINISAHHFISYGFVDYIKELLKEFPSITGHLITLEILESVSLDNLSIATKILKQLRELGISIALDDFGTGYASLSYLKNLPLDIIKIDKSFITNFVTDDKDKAIVKSIINLSNAFGYEVIAEGVEEIHQVDILRDLGCENIQGYYVSKPLTLTQAFNWVDD